MKIGIRALGSLATGVVLCAALSGCGSDSASDNSTEIPASANEELRALLPADIQDANTLTVATPYGVPPSIFVDDEGKPTGIAYDLGQAIGEELGVTMEWHELAFPSVIPGLQSGKYDLSMGVIADSTERHAVLDFVNMIGNRAVFLLGKGNPAGISDLTSICGTTIGALAGAYHVQVLNDASKAACDGNDVTVKEYPSNSDAQAQVASGQIDALRGPELVLNYTAQTAGNGGIFEVSEAGEPDNPFEIAMRKDRGDLADAIQSALLELYRSGEYQDIRVRDRVVHSPDQGRSGTRSAADLVEHRSICPDHHARCAVYADRVLVLAGKRPSRPVRSGHDWLGAARGGIHGRDRSQWRHVGGSGPVEGGCRPGDAAWTDHAAYRPPTSHAGHDSADRQPVRHPGQRHQPRLGDRRR